jgi:hypothetical protein
MGVISNVLAKYTDSWSDVGTMISPDLLGCRQSRLMSRGPYVEYGRRSHTSFSGASGEAETLSLNAPTNGPGA